MLVTAIYKGKKVAEYPITLGSINEQTTIDSYIAQAKENLLEDGLATEDNIDDFTFTTEAA